ncbi:hypothetical protein N7532_011704 [Penicillium argentinense]|uniref:RRM domain-containing protein n=1 Tax=Penicillium argentinense TaxID=1131581 RepID=A0A9W9EJ68_9EURO|nr:uncharacterized protein N7532_011704 [Penicillium argentinense]KAJ5082661.1 hypothetical protein N7532_011704 [Penicillium argentinense]
MSAQSPETGGNARSLPTDESKFDRDPRISFSKLDGKYILKTEDGQEFVYDEAIKRWVHTVDEQLLRQQQEAYKVAGVVDENIANPRDKKKRKKKGDANASDPKNPNASKNTAVFVSDLPLDAKVEEIEEVFSKAGVIAEEIDSQRPRIKMYTDENGKFKGEALVVYFRHESVPLAITLLDGIELRPSPSSVPQPQRNYIRVETASYSYKKTKNHDGTSQTNARDKKKIIERTQKMNSKLADWDDDEPSALPDTSSKFDKVMILKHMFTLKEIKEDPAAILDIKQDVREECENIAGDMGEVTNVVLYDEEPDGVISVRFTDPEAARACVERMNGRIFAGLRVLAYISDGSEKFKKTNERRAALEDMAERGLDAKVDSEAKRLDEFGAWLEGSDAVESTAK